MTNLKVTIKAQNKSFDRTVGASLGKMLQEAFNSGIIETYSFENDTTLVIDGIGTAVCFVCNYLGMYEGISIIVS